MRSHPRRTYAALAPLYDTLVPFVSTAARKTGLDWLNVSDGEHVLDAGVGTGLGFRPLLLNNPSGWTEGIDASPAMLRRAHHRSETVPHNRYGLRREEMTALPYPPNTFDAVFAAYAIDVLPAPSRPSALRALHRVLSPTGRLVIVSMAPPRLAHEHVWALASRIAPVMLGGDRPMSVPFLLRDLPFTIRRFTTQAQLGVRSSITVATPLSR